MRLSPLFGFSASLLAACVSSNNVPDLSLIQAGEELSDPDLKVDHGGTIRGSAAGRGDAGEGESDPDAGPSDGTRDTSQDAGDAEDTDLTDAAVEDAADAADTGAATDADVPDAADTDVPDAADTDVPDAADTGAATDAAVTYYRDVKPILDAKCGFCHSPGGIGPMPLTTYDEVKRVAGVVRYDVEEGIMPPWRAEGPLDRYIGDRRLSEEQKQIVLDWVDDGTPEGDPEQEPAPLAPPERGLPRVDRTLEIPEAYTPEVDPDDYRCFVLEWPEQEETFITGIGIEPDRTQMVHHAIAYLVGPGSADSARRSDANAEGPGYPCAGPALIGSWLTSYEPGGFGQELPSGVGLKVEPGSVIVLQMHYNTFKEKAPDRSTVEVMLADDVERVGSVSLILNYLWLVPRVMNIPANAAEVVHHTRNSPLSVGGAFDIYAVDLHMHQLGSGGRIGVLRADGRDEALLSIPDWAFEWQETFRFKQPVRVNDGDALYVECRYDNTVANQPIINGERITPRDVSWGDGTTDEMCLGNVLTAPAPAAPPDAEATD